MTFLDEDWRIELFYLIAKFSTGVMPDLSGMTESERWGLYLHLRRKSEASRSSP
jgi:hypothetical protein